ncbi:MAG TPA: hypothetical protein DET40_06840 [Lentisphaeria bacterium]|nr:MAG: hypothetical protein A2X45_07460 [Lentisphaerae bacterium GWF2_50_93]HCE43246.1 hypothetical protein [Lentisphaeria bacterium]
MRITNQIMDNRFIAACIFTAAFILCLTGTAADVDKNKKDGGKKKEQGKLYGQAVFPAEGRISLDEGTVEAWVSLDYSAGTTVIQDKSNIIPMIFFNFCEKVGNDKGKDNSDNYAGTDARMRLATFQNRRMVNYLAYNCSLFNYDAGESTLKAMRYDLEDFSWKENEWYFTAISWKKTGAGYDVFIYVNGKKKETAFDKSATTQIPKTLKDHLISIGSVSSAMGAVESLRISKKARTDEEMEASMKNGLSKDDSTLFLFDASTLTSMKKIHQEEFKNDTKVPDKGLFVGPYKTIKGKFGKAIQFHE